MKITSRLIIWLLCAGALVLACGPHAHHNESSASAADAPPPARPEAPPADGQVLATSANVAVGESVALSLHVTNLADHSVELDGAKLVEAFDRHFVMAAVHGLGGREPVVLAGAVEIRDSAERSAVLAVLDATNRWADVRR